MKKYKSIFTAVVIFCLMSVLVEAAILDQQQLLYDGSHAFWGDNPKAQTFTPSITGKLEKVYLELRGDPDVIVHVSIAEWNTNPETVLGVSDFYMDDFTGFVDFSSQSIILNAGSLYGIILANDLSYDDPPDPYRHSGTRVKHEDPYAGGSVWNGRNWGENWFEDTWRDIVFATYMVPEPASLLLLGLGGLALRLKWSR